MVGSEDTDVSRGQILKGSRNQTWTLQSNLLCHLLAV